MDCVGSNLGPGLEYVDGQPQVDLSSDTGNLLEFGSDDGLYGPATKIKAGTAVSITGSGTVENPYVINSAAQVGETAITAGPGITVAGAGVTSDPYVISADHPYCYGTMTSRPIDGANGTDHWVVPVISGASDPGFRLVTDSSGVTRVSLPLPGVWMFESVFRFNPNGGFTQYTDGQAGAMFYYAISGAGRGWITATTVSRRSSVLGANATLMDDWGTNPGTFGFRVQKSYGFVAVPSLSSGHWSAQYVGPTVSGVNRTAEEALAMERRQDGEG